VDQVLVLPLALEEHQDLLLYLELHLMILPPLVAAVAVVTPLLQQMLVQMVVLGEEVEF
jgi:hypothetical protein